MRFQRGQFALFFFLNSIAAVYERLYRKNKGLGHSRNNPNADQVRVDEIYSL